MILGSITQHQFYFLLNSFFSLRFLSHFVFDRVFVTRYFYYCFSFYQDDPWSSRRVHPISSRCHLLCLFFSRIAYSKHTPYPAAARRLFLEKLSRFPATEDDKINKQKTGVLFYNGYSNHRTPVNLDVAVESRSYTPGVNRSEGARS